MARNGKSATPATPAVHSLDSNVIRQQAALVTASAEVIARTTEEVAEGAAVQISAVDGVLSGLNEMSASLRETAGQAESVAASAEELVRQ